MFRSSLGKKRTCSEIPCVASSHSRLSSISEPFHSAAPTVSSMYRKLLKRVHKVLLRSRSSLWYSPATYGTPCAFLFTVRSHRVVQSSMSGFLTYCFDCACIIYFLLYVGHRTVKSSMSLYAWILWLRNSLALAGGETIERDGDGGGGGWERRPLKKRLLIQLLFFFEI